jgi:hypothetical protein
VSYCRRGYPIPFALTALAVVAAALVVVLVMFFVVRRWL